MQRNTLRTSAPPPANRRAVAPEPSGGASKVGSMVMASFGGACVVFTALMFVRSSGDGKPAVRPKPSASASAAAPSKHALRREDVTFPEMLTDQQRTTAMAAMRPQKGAASAQVPGSVAAPGDVAGLPANPLPAQDILFGGDSRPVTAADTLQGVARRLASEPSDKPMAESGHMGGVQLQVSSFEAVEEAQDFAVALRRRGYRAHVWEKNVPGRGTRFRVCIGPFKSRGAARQFRDEFESRERMVGLILEPEPTTVTVAAARSH